MNINLVEAKLTAKLTEYGRTMEFRLITKYDEQKAQDEYQEALNSVTWFQEELVRFYKDNPDWEEGSQEFVRIKEGLRRAHDCATRCATATPTSCYFCLDGAQIYTAVRMLRGEFESLYGGIALTDGYRHIRFYPDGLRVFLGNNEDYTIAFPGRILADAIDAATANLLVMQEKLIPSGVGYDDKFSYAAEVELSRDFVRYLTKGYAPWVEWDYADYSGIDNYPTMYQKMIDDKRDPRVSDSTLAECLDRLECSAGSYSDGKLGDGKPTIIHLTFDSKPPVDEPASYYFWIEGIDGKRRMNGGIIAHQKYVKGSSEKIQEWGYSTHT